jgi:hypothetical protein
MSAYIRMLFDWLVTGGILASNPATCLERLLPPRKDRPISFELPPIVSADDARRAIGTVLAAVADGRITPSEAVVVTSLIDAQYRAMGADVSPVRAANVQVSFVPSEPRSIVQ